MRVFLGIEFEKKRKANVQGAQPQQYCNTLAATITQKWADRFCTGVLVFKKK
jgi:hypothetical protein